MSLRRRRATRQSDENHERWLVSYADFITLLFAFFVVMYSVSSVNEGKYKVLSETLNAAFSNVPKNGSDLLISPGEPLRDIVGMPEAYPLARSAESPDEQAEKLRREAIRAVRKAASQQRVYDELAISLDEFIKNDLVELSRNGDRIEVNMKARMLFSSGDARLSDKAKQALRDLSVSIKEIPNPVQVEGHTDNVPITNFIYRSNWELSAARAASVVQFLTAEGIGPERLAAVGLGEYRPIADNTTDQGRARNRRVTLLILGAEPEMFAPDQIVPWAEGPAVGSP